MDAVSGALPEAKPCGSDLKAVFEEHYPRVSRVIARVIRDPGRAEELAVDVLLKFSRHGWKLDGDPSAWLFRTAVRTGLNELRRRARRAKYEALFSFIKKPATPEQVLVEQQNQTRIDQVLTSLSPRNAELILLQSHGLNYQEVGAALGLNPASVGTLLRRAKEAFRKEYTKRYGTR